MMVLLLCHKLDNKCEEYSYSLVVALVRLVGVLVNIVSLVASLLRQMVVVGVV